MGTGLSILTTMAGRHHDRYRQCVSGGEKIFKEYPYRGPRLLYQNLGTGRFKEVTAQMGPGICPEIQPWLRFLEILTTDGDIDVLVMNMNEPPLLLRNEYVNERSAGPNQLLKLKLVGHEVKPQRHRSASGIKGRLTVASSGGYQSIKLLLAQRSAPSLRLGEAQRPT